MQEEFLAPRFSLRQLQYLVAVAQTGSFSKAAERCRVSQPSLSAQVAQLEEVLDCQIFERSRRAIVVTRVGEALLERARSVLQAGTDFERAAEAAREPWSGTWRFGVIPTLAAYLLPAVSPTLGETYPDLRVVWREATTPQLVEALQQGRLEAALLALEADLKSLSTCVVAEDPFLLTVAAHHPMAKNAGPVSIDDLDDERLLLLEDGHCLRHQALEVCGREDLHDGGFEATSLTTLVEMVAIGEGITLLPAVAAPTVARDERIALLEFERPAPHRTIGLAWRSGTPLSNQLRAVADLFSEVVQQQGKT